jgi:hypothetical protein
MHHHIGELGHPHENRRYIAAFRMHPEAHNFKLTPWTGGGQTLASFSCDIPAHPKPAVWQDFLVVLEGVKVTIHPSTPFIGEFEDEGRGCKSRVYGPLTVEEEGGIIEE